MDAVEKINKFQTLRDGIRNRSFRTASPESGFSDLGTYSKSIAIAATGPVP
jgi:hypothetical protein